MERSPQRYHRGVRDILHWMTRHAKSWMRCKNFAPAVNQTDSVFINISDLASDEISSADESVILTIPFRRLADFLSQAERMQQVKEPKEGQPSIKSSRRTRKRRLSSSSAEELRSGDEAKFLEQERRIADRAAAEDGDFMATGAKRRG
ncbi:unnamed protein product [Clonostachys rhizophaga]|uniref:Uncharacterized protein n=1 Tax=Clonostachys rhizophaga TaxID=160324 RepID=A0A9N9YRE8_9HYPO|nr:unnamed protein product [Clonostachys rhizophaga]